jgi:hypothetical protein
MTRDKFELRTAVGSWQGDKCRFVHNWRKAGDGFAGYVDKTHGNGKVSRISTGSPQGADFSRLMNALDSKSGIPFSRFRKQKNVALWRFSSTVPRMPAFCGEDLILDSHRL